MPVIDLAFDLMGTSIPLDYGYGLFSALCRVVPVLHGDIEVGVHPIRGIRLGPRRLTLVPQSRLRLRLPSEEIASYLSLAGSRIDLEGDRLSIGVPRVEALRPAPGLTARLVTVEHITEPESFVASLRTRMAKIGVEGTPSLQPSPDPDRSGEASRRVMRIKGRRIVGYSVDVSGLTGDGSILLQEKGLGSRRRMGCGVFISTRRSQG